MRYEVYITNFGYFYDCDCSSIEEAIEVGRSRGYEFSVHEANGGKMVGFARGVSLQWHNCEE